jgi:Uncharacterized conserved protein (DUF2190)
VSVLPDYNPVFTPGRAITLTASATITSGDIVEVSGSGTVAKAALSTNGSTKIVGVASKDAVANERVTIHSRGIVHESIPQGTVTAGDQLTAALTGATGGAQVQTIPAVGAPVPGDVTATRALIGIALTTATNPTKVRWMEC